jgi:esterase
MKLYSKVFGQGQPLVVLHGLYGSSDNWMSIGRELSNSFRVILVDQRNHGRSPHSPNHSYDDLAGDLLELLMSKDVVNPIIIGHSMGGKVAINFARTYPNMVKALIVLDILPFSYRSIEELLFTQEQQHAKIISSLLMLRLEDANSREELDESLSIQIPDKSVRQFLLKGIKRDKNGQFVWQLNLEALSNNLANMMDTVLPESFAESINVPTLFLKGENSNYISPKGEGMLKNFFSNYNAVSIPNAGHWLHAENPQAVLTEIMRFTAKI